MVPEAPFFLECNSFLSCDPHKVRHLPEKEGLDAEKSFQAGVFIDLPSLDTERAKTLRETFEKATEGKEWSSCPLACPPPCPSTGSLGRGSLPEPGLASRRGRI